MQQDFRQEQNYIKAKKRVKDIKGFYIHLTVYIIINIFISGVIIYGLMVSGDSFTEAFSNFGVYSTWLFWGIGMFFHWLGVFGFKSIGFGRDWEERKIKEMMEKDDEKKRLR
ncbi:2TM domain-containing protein [Polaribacter septentrionalilitoris]|uniref:2TM domain-containing protein n=1 Tax=Polaribacter septentrionalilitoris TaxID=2494657 RepID=UPI00135A61B4|nr:2TM domain-containing protein [Polaribacter septentrionalilitoris]